MNPLIPAFIPDSLPELVTTFVSAVLSDLQCCAPDKLYFPLPARSFGQLLPLEVKAQYRLPNHLIIKTKINPNSKSIPKNTDVK